MDYLGIDPGKSGAIALITKHNIITAVFEKETYRDIIGRCDSCNTFCLLEKVFAMPKQGVVSMFNFGENFGFIQGLLCANKIAYQMVTAAKWKREFQITSDKNSSISVCERLFPTQDLKKGGRYKKSHDGIAEALLLAELARRTCEGNGTRLY